MRQLLVTADWMERIVQFCGRLGAWIILPLIAVIMFDILTRKFHWSQQLISNSWLFNYISSGHLQDWEWHLHTVLFLCVLGYAYTRNAHVRVDILRDKLAPRGKAWIELIGCLVFLIPFSVLLLYYAIPFVEIAWIHNEQSQSMTGLKHRWAIKAFLIPGFALILLAGLSTVLRLIVFLFGPLSLRGEVEITGVTDNTAELAGASRVRRLD